MNWFEIAANMSGPEHDESETQQEEVNVVVSGSGVFRVDGEEVPFTAPVAFRFDPETVRQGLHRRPRRADDGRGRSAPRQLLAARPVLMLVRFVLWSLTDSDDADR